MGGAVAELGFVKHHAGKEGAEGKETSNSSTAPKAMPSAGQHRQSEQLA